MRHLLLIASLLLPACGASGSRPADGPGTQAGAGSNMVCHEERSPGSTVPRDVCRPKAQSDLDKKGAEDLMNSPASAPPATGVGGH
jgi:hypothetical protein